MARPQPLWRRAFDKVERAAGSRLEQAVQSPRFADAASVVTQLERRVQGLVEQRTRRVWHAVNLPAGSDVRRLREQLVDVDRQLRTVTTELERLRRLQEDSVGPGRTQPARRRASGPPRG